MSMQDNCRDFTGTGPFPNEFDTSTTSLCVEINLLGKTEQYFSA